LHGFYYMVNCKEIYWGDTGNGCHLFFFFGGGEPFYGGVIGA